MERQQNMDHTPDATQTGVGAALREARETLGMSVEEVAIRLKFSPRQITALEEENFEQLPQLAFVRGFVRSYARLLQIAEEPLLEALPGTPARETAPAKRTREDVLPGDSGMRKQNLLWLTGALAVALVIVFLAWKHDAGEVVPKPAAGAKNGTEAKPAPEAQNGEASQSSELRKAVSENQTGPENQAASEIRPGSGTKSGSTMKSAKESTTAASVPETPNFAAAKPAARAAVPASAVAVSKEAAPHKQRPAQPVRLEFDEDSWVEIKDGDGKILLSMVGKQGSSRSVSGSPPLSLTIGNAKGVRVYYKDESVDLGTHADQDVAHLRLE